MEQQSFFQARCRCIAGALLSMSALIGPMAAQAADGALGPTAGADAIVTGAEPGKPPSKHREVMRAPVKPTERPSKPQQAINRLR